MADGSVRGTFELEGRDAIRTLGTIRDRGLEADAALDRLGSRMDTLGRKSLTMSQSISATWSRTRLTIDQEADRMGLKIDEITNKLDRFGSMRSSARVELSGFDRVNAQISELEARLDALSRKRASPHVAIGGGFASDFAGRGAGGGGVTRTVDRSGGGFGGGGMLGRLPWWSVAVPFAPQLGGAAVGLLGSASSAVAGAGTVGLGAAGALGAGGILTMAAARPAIQGLTAITTAQQNYNKAIEEFGRKSTQAATAQKALNVALVQNPLAAGAARQYGLFRRAYTADFRGAQQQVYRGVSGVLYNARRGMPSWGQSAQIATSATSTAAIDYSRFLTQPQQLSTVRQLVDAFASDMPLIERALQNVTTMFGHLAVDATPFFHQGLLWIDHWTAGLAKSSADTTRVQSRMQGFVNSAKDWAHLTGAAYRTIRDLFNAGTPAGNSMIVSLTNTFDRWDRWITANPQKVDNFFHQAVTTTDRVATTIGNLIHDVMQVFNYLSPIISRGLQFLQFASGGGAGGIGVAGSVLYGAYSGLRGASGGRLPSGGALASSFIVGGAGPGAARSMGGVPVGGEAATAALDRGGILGTAGRYGGAALAGAARFLGPTLAINGLLGLLGAHGGVQAHVGGLLSGLSAGFISPHTAAAIAPAVMGGGAAIGLASLPAAITRQAAGAFARAAPGSLASRASSSVLDAIGGRAVGLLGRVGLGTLGAYAGMLISPASTGASLGNARTRASVTALANQASNVRTPAQMHAVLNEIDRIHPIMGELPPDQARRLQAELTRISTVASKNAGIAASNSWEQSFQTGLTTVGPKKDIRLLLSGMDEQIKELGPKGAKQFVASTASWINVLQQEEPKLRKPLQRAMDAIMRDFDRMYDHGRGKFKDLANQVFYFNGQIYTGVNQTWGAISSSLVDKVAVAQEKQQGIWGLIQAQAENVLTTMGFSRSQAQQLVTQTARGGRSAAVSASIVGAVNQGATASTLNTSPTSAFSPYQAGRSTVRATGGVISGRGLLDTVMMPDGSMAAPGEAWIANRHTMNDLSLATLSKFGKTAWEMIRDETRMHSSPPRRGQHFFGGRMAVPSAIQTSSTVGGSAGYVYPFPGLQPGRTDQGYDLSGSGPLYALGPGRVLTASLWPGWPGTGGVVYQLTGGPDAGRNVYYMEHVQANVTPGQMVQAGQPIATLLSGYPFLEAGWANASGTGPLTPYNGSPDGTPMSGGSNFRAFVNALLSGGRLPAGIGAAGMGGGMMALPSVHLRSPRSGLAGVPGAVVDQSGRNYAAALQQKLNQRLGTMGGTGLGGSFSGTLSGSVENQVAQFMGAAGFNKIAIAGMLGNAMQESSMNPGAAGGGLWQQISNFGGGSGGSLLNQMQRMLPQIQSLKAAMNAAGSPGAAAQIFEQGFERAGIPAMGNRINYANQAYASGYARGGRLHWGGWNARGANFLTNGPTVFGAGEGGRRERVSVTPANTPTHPGRSIAVHFNGPVHITSDDDIETIGRHVAGKIMDALDDASSGITDHELMTMGAGNAN